MDGDGVPEQMGMDARHIGAMELVDHPEGMRPRAAELPAVFFTAFVDRFDFGVTSWVWVSLVRRLASS
jgi:hypothetical protein